MPDRLPDRAGSLGRAAKNDETSNEDSTPTQKKQVTRVRPPAGQALRLKVNQADSSASRTKVPRIIGSTQIPTTLSPRSKGAHVKDAAIGPRFTSQTKRAETSRLTKDKIPEVPEAMPDDFSRSTSETAKSPRTPVRKSLLVASSTVPRLAPSPKPAFNNYQRSFSPTKRALPRSTSSLTQGFATPSKLNSPARIFSNPPQTSFPSLSTLRAQAQLLQLHSLHETAQSTLTAYSSSARKQLHAKFCSLQETYEVVVLPLEHQVRQQRNLLALQEWSGGNVIGLRRKLGVLTDVLAKLILLTTPQGSLDSVTGTHAGAYTKLADQFEAWINWVKEVWQDRESLTTKLDSIADDTSIASSKYNIAFTAIEGLGDSIKFEIRAMSTTLGDLASRIQDVSGLPFESTHESSTPAIILRLTTELLSNMQDELQVMRELECEVVLGEDAWLAERLHGLSAGL